MKNHKKIEKQPKFNAKSTMLFSIADMAYQNRDYKNAVPLFEKAEKNDPNSLLIKEMLILSLGRLSQQDKTQTDKLLQLSEKYLKEGFQSDDIYLPRINALISKHLFKKAINELEKSIKIKPSPEKYYKLFLLEGFVENKTNISLLKKAMKLSDNEKYDMSILNNLNRMGNPITIEMSKFVYDKWDDEDTFEFYSEILIKHKKSDKFLEEIFNRINKKGKISKVTISKFLKILYQRNSYETIDKYVDYLLEFNDSRIDRILFSTEDTLKNYNSAISIMKRILSNYSLDNEDKQILLFFLINTYIKNSNTTEVAHTLAKITDFGRIEYLIERIKLTDNKNILPEIMTEFLALNNADSNFKLFFQYCYEKEDNPIKFDFLNKINPTKLNKKNIVYLTDIYLANNKIKKAKKIFEKLPDIKESFNVFAAYFYMAEKDYKKAKKLIEDELQQKQSINTYLFYSSILENNNQIKKAIEALQTANKKYPHNSEILNGLGYMITEHNGKLDIAEKYLLEASKLDSTSTNIWDSLMWLYYKKGEYQKALNIFPKDKLDDISNSTIAYHLGEIYLKLGVISEAEHYFNLAIELNTENDAVNKSQNKLKEIKEK
jgi:tetratricopeptide (TPR) repeat protein